jgi:protein TonB
LLPKGAEEDMERYQDHIKLPPKKEEPKLNVPPHPPPPKVDQVKFVNQWLLRQKK